MNDPSRQTAAEELGVSLMATPEETRAAFLRRLAADDFVPPPAQIAAAERLGMAGLPCNVDVEDVRREYEQADFDALVKEFWSHAPAERTARWHTLNDRIRDPHLAREMKRLAAGLPIPVQDSDNVPEQAIANIFQELFLLPARARAIRRAEWLAEQSNDPGIKSATLRLTNLTVLDPPLFKLLSGHPDTRDTQPYRSNPLFVQMNDKSSSGFQVVEPISEDIQRNLKNDEEKKRIRELKELQKQATKLQKQATKQSVDSNNITKYSWLVGVLVIGIIKIGLGGLSSTKAPITIPSDARSSEQKGRIPPLTPNDLDNREQLQKSIEKMFTADQVIQFEKYDPQSSEPKPNGYTQWVFWGKPKVTNARTPSQLFTPEQIELFQNFDPNSGRPPPFGFETWQKIEKLKTTTKSSK